jgi:hypothetical protein
MIQCTQHTPSRLINLCTQGFTGLKQCCQSLMKVPART